MTKKRNEMDKLAELMKKRASTYGLLARMFRVEIDRDTLHQLQSMRFPTNTGNNLADQGYRQIYNYLKTAWDESITELAVDYVRCFIGHGVNGYSAAYPYESVYTSERRLMMQEARAEVLAIMRENNLKRDRWNEGEDHIALELEFMQRIAIRTQEALAADNKEEAVHHLQSQADFIHNHLLNWLPMLHADMLQFAKTDFYRGLADLTLGFVSADADLLEELLED